MSAATQEIVALLIVGLVVAVALWTRWRKRQAQATNCDGCTKPSPRAAKTVSAVSLDAVKAELKRKG
ncbi:MAG: hypothetical protein AAFN78_14885 [Pseudomonadota bacterium]